MYSGKITYIGLLLAGLIVVTGVLSVFGQPNFEKRRISSITMNIDGVEANTPLTEEYKDIVHDVLGPTYSAPRIRDAIEDLYFQAKTINSITVTAEVDAAGDVGLTFKVKMKTQAQRVSIIGDFNDWQIDSKYLMNQTPDGERYWLTFNNLEKGKEYAFQYLIEGKTAIGDPFCEKILDPRFDSEISASTYPNLKLYPSKNTYGGTVSVLQTGQTPYNWKVKDFKRPAKEKLVIYELLVRDFINSRKYREVADSIAYFKRLGINAIELMPINEFTANNSWGYNPTYYTAPDKAYGTKDDLKYLIDK